MSILSHWNFLVSPLVNPGLFCIASFLLRLIRGARHCTTWSLLRPQGTSGCLCVKVLTSFTAMDAGFFRVHHMCVWASLPRANLWLSISHWLLQGRWSWRFWSLFYTCANCRDLSCRLGFAISTSLTRHRHDRTCPSAANQMDVTLEEGNGWRHSTMQSEMPWRLYTWWPELCHHNDSNSLLVPWASLSSPYSSCRLPRLWKARCIH